MAAAPAPRAPAVRPLPQPAEPLEIDEEGDPYAAGGGTAPVARPAAVATARTVPPAPAGRPPAAPATARYEARPSGTPLVLQPGLAASSLY